MCSQLPWRGLFTQIPRVSSKILYVCGSEKLNKNKNCTWFLCVFFIILRRIGTKLFSTFLVFEIAS